MERSWYVRLGLVLAVVLGAVYLLIPTFVYFSLPADVRNDREAFEAALPAWAPKRHVNLGLDLQGGVHLVLGVDLDKAERDKVVRRADELRNWATNQKLSFQSIRADPEERVIQVDFASEAAADAFSRAATSYFGDMERRRGGTSTTWAFTAEAMRNYRDGAVDQALRTIRNRVDKWGVTEPTIARRGENGVLVQLPGVRDPEQAKELLGRTAQLQFQIVADELAGDVVRSIRPLPEGVTLGDDGYQPFLQSTDLAALQRAIEGKAPEGTEFVLGRIETGPGAPTIYRTYLLHSKVELTGDRLTDARPQIDQSALGGGRPYVGLTFDAEGAQEFERLTGANVGKRLAIVLDDTVNSAPVIQTRIAGGNAQITLGGNRNYNQLLQEASELSLVLRSGALPAPVNVLEERSVGASLGPELIRKGSLSAVIGLILVMLFMVIYYRAAGLIADVALVLNGLLLLAALAVFGATLTLPGIAGFILTLGMAVDANVLINERIREEVREGRTPKAAVNNGYGKAFWTIFDANVTTLIAALILMQYGTGPVRGFAVTLVLGLIASVFTAIVVTRVIVDARIRGRAGEKLSV